MDRSCPLCSLFLSFQQLTTLNMFILNVADGWIRTTVLWCWMFEGTALPTEQQPLSNISQCFGIEGKKRSYIIFLCTNNVLSHKPLPIGQAIACLKRCLE